MKIFKKLVEGCMYCPDCFFDSEYYRCSKDNSLLGDLYTIPSFCPLDEPTETERILLQLSEECE